MSLNEVLNKDDLAAEFYRELHPSVRSAVLRRADEIVLSEDLYAIANNAMNDRLEEYVPIFDDAEN